MEEQQPVSSGDLISAEYVNQLLERIQSLEAELAPFLVDPAIESVRGQGFLGQIQPGKFVRVDGRNFAADPNENRVHFVRQSADQPDQLDIFPKGSSASVDAGRSSRSRIFVRVPAEVGTGNVRLRVAVGQRPFAEKTIFVGSWSFEPEDHPDLEPIGPAFDPFTHVDPGTDVLFSRARPERRTSVRTISDLRHELTTSSLHPRE